jgi:hypothetical protein
VTYIATHGEFTLIRGYNDRILLSKGGTIVNDEFGQPMAFGSIGSAVAWIRA